MFERYTEKARRVIFFARYEASQFGAPAIEPEHLLLGLMREDKIITAQYIVWARTSLEIIQEEIRGRGPLREKISTSVELPLSPECKRVLGFASEESDRLRHKHIGMEHLLLGLLREKQSIASEILSRWGMSSERVIEAASQLKNAKYLLEAALITDAVELDLSDTGLNELPKQVSRLSQLKRLKLSNNRLISLPEFVGQLTQLELLDLTNNLLTHLPDSLSSLRALKNLHLGGNDGLGLPLEILGHWSRSPDPAAILEYYYQVQRSSRSLNEAKLILVGRGAVGKTSIVNRLVYSLFRDEKKTEGIQITRWNIRLKEQELVRLNVWDFGGQEIMHATHQFFLTQRSLYMLVLNGRDGDEDNDVEYWLRLIESFGEGSPVIVVLNKIQEHPFDVNYRALQQKYPSIRAFIKTDCEDGHGVKELRKVIERETDLLDHLRDPIPESWFAIKNKLSGMRDNYLSFERYREVCSALGETDPASQESLSSYLHNLGIVLNYRDDPRLQDTHVLNPHWVTQGIYKILNSKKLAEQKGEIYLKDLSEILDEKEYPGSMHRFLFDLMKKFELCFSFPEDDCHYLIPELLDKQEPEVAAVFKSKECLNFEYHYPILPEGLLPRFIVRTHVLSEGQYRWRTGVILRFEGNSALVKSDAQDRKVFIHVSGPILGRRRLLAIIRSDFERIHHDIRNLQPQEMIPLPSHPAVVVPFQELFVMEQNGRRHLPKVVGEQVIDVDINEVLNGIDVETPRRKGQTIKDLAPSIRLFYSYSHKDEGLRNEMDVHLKLLQRQGLIETWHDRKIEAGDDWKVEIDKNLERAEIILLLISADFIASDYCYEKEMKRALERQEIGDARVIPIIVRDVNWRRSPFSKHQALPSNGIAVSKWVDKDSAWRDVSEGIERVVNEMRQRPMQ